MVKSFEQIDEEMNIRFEELKEKSDIYKESDRMSFLYGWLCQAYKQLYFNYELLNKLK